MRVALGQINTTIGDFAGNLKRIRRSVAGAREAGADVIVLPELSLCGYPPMDLLDRPSFVRSQEQALAELATEARGIAIVTGAVMPAPEGSSRPLVNAAVALVDGRVDHVQAKTLLPTYDVFDEARYFESARDRRLWTHRGVQIGLTICEDVWGGDFWGPDLPYRVDPVAELVEAGAEMLITVSASPWEQRKIQLREAMLAHASRLHGVPLVFVNLVGGNDELIFDGASLAISRDGEVMGRLARFEEDLGVFEPLAATEGTGGALEPEVELLQRALVLGIRDYLHKLGMKTAVVGLSGGIDSAVTADLAARALGPENVLGILMPGPFSSEHSVTDAVALAKNLGIESRTVPIETIYGAFLDLFRGLFGARDGYGLTQENLQARIRGTLLMAVSNFEDRIVLATGNKSELSMGYTTLYGDLVGGLAVLGDVLKRDVYDLARFSNHSSGNSGARIPLNTLEKPPSAELAPDQLDTDSLPEYDTLDAILEAAIEGHARSRELATPEGVDPELVRRVLGSLDRAEYKRRQAPIVLRTSPKAFGSGRRIPIVQRSSWGV